MEDYRQRRMHPGWWTVILIAVLITVVSVCSAMFAGTFRSSVPVLLTADRSGLVMESGAKVKMRGVVVGRVSGIRGGVGPAALKLEIDPDTVEYIPVNVQAQIRATTAFGAKYVDLIYPTVPSADRLSAGAVLHSQNVSTEVNTVFQNLVGLLERIDVVKLNAVLSALAEGVRGRGQQIGEATAAMNQVLLAINPRMAVVHDDWRSLKGFSDTYAAAARDIVTILDAASTTGTTITDHAADLDALLLNTIGFARDGTDLLAATKDNFVRAVNLLEPTTNLLMKYNPEITCMLVGAKFRLDNGGYEAFGGNGRTMVVDSSLLLSDDPYRYPDNLPIVAAKGGPDGRPGCGSLPDVSKDYPVRKLITNTGWGTGLDNRPNPGIAHPWWINFLPVTRAVPEPPSIRGMGPPAIGPVPHPGAPPYGAPLFGPDGQPLHGPVGAAPPPAPESP